MCFWPLNWFYNEFNVDNSILSFIFYFFIMRNIGKRHFMAKIYAKRTQIYIKKCVFLHFSDFFYHIIRLLIKLNFGNHIYNIVFHQIRLSKSGIITFWPKFRLNTYSFYKKMCDLNNYIWSRDFHWKKNKLFFTIPKRAFP